MKQSKESKRLRDAQAALDEFIYAGLEVPELAEREYELALDEWNQLCTHTSRSRVSLTP